jgi:tight adherence protein B
MSALAAIALVGAVLLALPSAPRHRLGRLGERAGGGGRRLQWRALGWPLAVVAPVVAGFAVAAAPGATIGFCLGAVWVTCWAVWLDHRARRGSRQRSEQVVVGCLALAGLLRVGHVPAAALRIAAADSPVLAEAAAVQQVGGQVPTVLRRLGSTPGGAGLTELAIAWEVSGRTGASLTATLDALADRLDASRKLRRVVDAELSAPRATSRMLAALPLAGLGLGFAFGGDPVAFLLGTGLGQFAMCAGVALACAGVWWTERIARAAGG